MKRKLYIKLIVTLLINCSILLGITSIGFCNNDDVKMPHDNQPKIIKSKTDGC